MPLPAARQGHWGRPVAPVVHGLRRSARFAPRTGGAVMLLADARVACCGWYGRSALPAPLSSEVPL